MRVRFAAVAAIGFAAIGASYSRVHAQPPAPLAQEAARTASRSVWDGVYTKEQSARGKEAYTNRCSQCHLDSLMGSDMTPALVGGEFLSNWTDTSVSDLFDRIRKTMPLNKPGSVPRDEISDILAYILSSNKIPAGDTELSHDTQVLMQIRIEPTKPDQPKKSDANK